MISYKLIHERQRKGKTGQTVKKEQKNNIWRYERVVKNSKNQVISRTVSGEFSFIRDGSPLILLKQLLTADDHCYRPTTCIRSSNIIKIKTESEILTLNHIVFPTTQLFLFDYIEP